MLKKASSVSTESIVYKVAEFLSRAGCNTEPVCEEIPGEAEFSHCSHLHLNGKGQEACRFFRNLYMYDPDNPGHLSGLGMINQMNGDYAKACAYYALTSALFPDNLQVVYWHAVCRMLTGELHLSETLFQRVLSDADSTGLKNNAQFYLSLLHSDIYHDANVPA